MTSHSIDLLCLFLLVLYVNLSASEQVELIPKLVRWPTHIDHYLCRQLHSGIGIRSLAVTNLNGDLCRTYCRIIDRMNGKITYTENVTPNFVRCGPSQARCVDGNCVGLNFPNAPGAPSTAPTITAESSANETTIESSEVYNSDAQVLGQVDGSANNTAVETPSPSPDYMYPISSSLAKELISARNSSQRRLESLLLMGSKTNSKV